MGLLFAWWLACAPDPGVTVRGGPSLTETGAQTGVSEDSGGDSAWTGETGADSAGETGAPPPEPYHGPAAYPPGEVHSPITPYVLERVQAIVSAGDGAADVFSKVGDSITVDGDALYCFAGGEVDLAEHADLDFALQWFNAGDAGGDNPFDRDSLAALGGKTASWALSGDPSPIEDELAGAAPRYALVQFGTNDMNMGTTYASALWGYAEDMQDLADVIVGHGVVPVFLSIPPRTNQAEAYLWVPTYNAVVRAVAAHHQVPFVDLHLGLEELPDFGLHSDGVHLDVLIRDGVARGCILDAEGLEHGNNTRNLLQLQALDRLQRALDAGVAPDEVDAGGAGVVGSGTSEDPFLIGELPFSHVADTSLSSQRAIDRYDGCDADQDESGAEVVYRLDLDAPTAVRAMVLDRGDVDLDLHLLEGAVDGDRCVERDHHMVDTTLEPGVWYLVVDTFVADGEALSGEGMVVVHACVDGDPDC